MTAILIVEDETHLADGLRFNLELENYQVEIAADGETALALLDGNGTSYDLIILDVMLPNINGFEVAAKLRASQNYTPILMLTARTRPEDVLRGFEAGADDYLPKPFELAILMARVKGLLRRRQWLEQTSTAASSTADAATLPLRHPEPVVEATTFTVADCTLDFDTLELRTPHRTVNLTLMEATLLRYLVERQGRTVSRKQLLEDVWNLHEDTDTRAIDNFIVRLRRYIERDSSKPQHLLTVRGIGYRLEPKSNAGE